LVPRPLPCGEIYVLAWNMALELSSSPNESGEVERRPEVKAELDRILHSPGFRTSKRSQQFLRYIVLTALEGRFDDLKERVIGHVVFHRVPDYDTGEHSIVRVKANELRKRLAQYYSETSGPFVVQIHLPRGSYTPEFRWMATAMPELDPEAATSTQEQPIKASSKLSYFVLAALVTVSLTVGAWYLFEKMHASGVAEQFWQPVLQGTNAPLICVADPEVLKLNDNYDALAFNGTLPANIPASALVRDSGHYVGWGDAVALAQLSTFFALHHKQPEIRMSNDVSYTELSKAPAILIGARSNPWTVQLANNLRFAFERTQTQSYIQDNQNPGKRWNFELGPPKVDYIVITRVFESKTGKMIVLAAGLSHFGTQAAGQLLTDPTNLSKALKDAPAGWQKRNLQLLFRVEIFGSTAGQPVLVASKFW
jgi:hypothetical protein